MENLIGWNSVTVVTIFIENLTPFYVRFPFQHGSVEAGRNNERAVHRNKHRPMMMTTTTETQREAVVGSAHEPTTPQCSKTYKNNDDLAVLLSPSLVCFHLHPI